MGPSYKWGLRRWPKWPIGSTSTAYQKEGKKKITILPNKFHNSFRWQIVINATMYIKLVISRFKNFVFPLNLVKNQKKKKNKKKNIRKELWIFSINNKKWILGGWCTLAWLAASIWVFWPRYEKCSWPGTSTSCLTLALYIRSPNWSSSSRTFSNTPFLNSLIPLGSGRKKRSRWEKSKIW